MRNSQTKAGSVFSASYSNGGDETQHGSVAQGAGSANAGAGMVPFNPTLALQTLLSGDMVTPKQRARAAQQLAQYFKELPAAPGLYAAYEPYLQLVVDVMLMTGKGARDLQACALEMLGALSGHNPRRFSDWMTQLIHRGYDAWLVEWSSRLLIEGESRLPRAESGRSDYSDGAPETPYGWNEKTMEFLEFDAAFGRVIQLWRTILDHADDEQVVQCIVENLSRLLSRKEELSAAPSQWHTMIIGKLQVHFVDIADVLIGWATSTRSLSGLRERIVALLQQLAPLWADNSVFSLQLMTSFAEEITLRAGSFEENNNKDIDSRVSILLVCFLLIARNVPELALAHGNSDSSPLERVLQSVKLTCIRDGNSTFCAMKCSEFLASLSAISPDSFSVLSIEAARFLCRQVAQLAIYRGESLDASAQMMTNICSIVEASAASLATQPSSIEDVIGILTDEIGEQDAKTGCIVKSTKVLDCLVRQFTHDTARMSKLLFHLQGFGGLRAMKEIALCSVQKLRPGMNSINRLHSYMYGSCFISALDQYSRRQEPVSSSDIACLGAIVKALAEILEDTATLQLASSQIRMIAKMATVALRAARQFDLDDRADACMELSTMQLLSRSLTLLMDIDVMAKDELLTMDLFALVGEAWNQHQISGSNMLSSRRALLAVFSFYSQCSSENVRKRCLSILTKQTSLRHGVVGVDTLAQIALGFAVQPSKTIQQDAAHQILSVVAADALTTTHLGAVVPDNQTANYLKYNFTGVDFERVVRLLGDPACDVSAWRSLCSAIHDRNEANGDIDASFGISTSELLGGVVRAAARWCVHNRLRTHFGGPAQTFSCIEQLLMSIVFRMPRGSDAKSSSPLVSGSSQSSKVTAQTTVEQGIGDWIALEFVGALELCISHAYSTRGSDQDPESESSRTLQFYRSNKVVCDDWLNRIRPLLIELSARSGSSDLRRIHSYASVSSMSMRIQRILKASASRAAPSKLSQELASAAVALDSALFALCCCCSDLKDVDAIAGFQRWGELLSKEMSARCAASSEMGECPTANLFPWLEGPRLEASMQYEDAVVFYEALLRPIVDCAQSPSADTGQGSVVEMLDNSLRYLQMSPSTLLGCVKQCTHCYIALQRWPQAKDLVATILRIEETLVGHDQSSPALQPFVDSMRVWRHELDSTLFFSEDVRLPTCGIDDLVNRLRVCALQPEPLSGNSVSKKVEQLFLDISRITHGENGEAAIGEGFGIGAGVFDSLDAHVHDSTQWGDYLLRARDIAASTPHGSGLEPRYLAFAKVASLARQQRNFELCGRLLNETEAVRTSLQSASLTVASEKAALLISRGTEDEGVRLLADACVETLRLGSDSLPNDAKNETVQALGLLGSSLQTTAVTLDGSALVDTLLQDQSFPALDVDCFDETDMADGDSLDVASGKCFYLGTCIAQSSPMAWLQYGNWCYQVEKRKTAEIAALNGYAHLLPFEEAEINTALDDLDVCGPSRDAIIRGFCHLFENRALISQCGENFQHLCHQHLQIDGDNLTVAKLVKLHSTFAARVLRYHLLAADNYSTYLELQGESSGSPCTTQDTMMVTLRLLNLLTDFGTYEEIGASIERTIAGGPVAPWIPLVPQLICRVGHPNPTVARLVCLLLKRIARSSPHLIVYPVVANSTDGSRESEFGCDSSPGLRGVLQVLKHVSSELVDGVALLVAELRRVSVLWDEAWISTLLKLSTYVGRRTVAIEKESARVARNSSLAQEEMRQLAQRKCATILTPVLQTLESLWSSTCGSAGSRGLLTPHERSFLRDYGGDIGQALANLRGQCDADAAGGSAATPQRVQAMWEPFNVILKALINSVGRRERIGLHDISPAMVSIPETFRQTNMPGVFTRAGDGPEAFMRIQAILPAVAVLKTKTKPKCLQFIGSDGAKQRYLLKAKEDLRLDERVMQFLTAVNTMLSADKAAAVRELGAQHYSVIPISEDAGLIQMVPNVKPFFQIYTSHQDQVHGARGPQMSPPPASGSGGVAMPGLHQPQPPTVQFYAALKRHGISNVSQRSKWPLAVLRQVYAELVNQMPRNTVKQELMLHSRDLKENWMKNSRLSRSMAVMSVLGYTIGLGDRHLDNILLHVDTGNVVHIDYNVCFDKGLKLKVPEVVPFRLTPMLQDALGLTGVDGVFRAAFETTLRVVRSDASRESLLSLLEAFVYSPLTEWKADDSRRAGRAGDNDSDEPEGMSSVASGPANSSGDVTAEGSASSLTSGQDVLEAPTGSRESPTALAQSRYGLEVLSRIEDKLSGIVHDGAGSSRVFTVEQQASWLIAEATKVDNLCAMYEGWTPWI